jgi:hypothetical protein
VPAEAVILELLLDASREPARSPEVIRRVRLPSEGMSVAI